MEIDSSLLEDEVDAESAVVPAPVSDVVAAQTAQATAALAEPAPPGADVSSPPADPYDYEEIAIEADRESSDAISVEVTSQPEPAVVQSQPELSPQATPGTAEATALTEAQKKRNKKSEKRFKKKGKKHPAQNSASAAPEPARPEVADDVDDEAMKLAGFLPDEPTTAPVSNEVAALTPGEQAISHEPATSADAWADAFQSVDIPSSID